MVEHTLHPSNRRKDEQSALAAAATSDGGAVVNASAADAITASHRQPLPGDPLGARRTLFGR
jgi:hypothetical protein